MQTRRLREVDFLTAKIVDGLTNQRRYRLNHPNYDPSLWSKTHPEERKTVQRKSMKKARILNPEKFKIRDKEQYIKHKKERILGEFN